MNFVLDQRPWEEALAAFAEDEALSALEILTLLETADEEETEMFLDSLAEKHITIDIATLPKIAGNGAAAVRLQREEKLVKQGNLPAGLEENDPLRLYFEELADIPAAEVDVSDKDKLTDALLPQTAERAYAYVGRGVLLLDLIQEANLGLWQGIQSYTQGDIIAHCNWWSDHYLSRAVLLQAKATGVGQKLRQAMEDYRSVDEKLLTELGRNPKIEEIAEALHISVEETEMVAQSLDNTRMLSRAKQPEPEELPQEEDQAVEDTAYFQMRQRILELLSVLSEEEKQLLTLRYGLEGGIPQKPEQVAQKLGITAEQVVAAEAAALMKLRQEQ